MTKKYRSEACAAIHETMDALHDVGAIDKQTLREFDASCLTPTATMPPERVSALHERERLSQTS
jgi:putative transcriptional regulator